MFENTMPRYEILSEESMAVLDKGWRRIVSELGIEFMKPEAVELFKAAGMRTDGDKVFFDPDFVLEQVAKAVYQPDVYRQAAEALIAEGKLKASDFPDFASEQGYRGPQDGFIDGLIYDGRHPNAYLQQFAIGLKGDERVQ